MKLRLNIITFSKTGLPTLSEYGGGDGKKGVARLICSSKGKRLRPIPLAIKLKTNDDHAIFVISSGYFIVEVEQRELTYLTISEITQLGVSYDKHAIVTKIIFKKPISPDLAGVPPKFLDVVVNAVNKANHKNCRIKYYHKG